MRAAQTSCKDFRTASSELCQIVNSVLREVAQKNALDYLLSYNDPDEDIETYIAPDGSLVACVTRCSEATYTSESFSGVGFQQTRVLAYA
jgi:hypothetical protein